MCLIFDFKRVALRAVDLLEIFIYTDSPEQARKVILHQKPQFAQILKKKAILNSLPTQLKEIIKNEDNNNQ
jgi:hypothetical protein